MKNTFTFFILIIFLSGFSTYAQENDSLLYKWTPAAVLGLNISQIALSNWTKGGDNSISWTGAANGSVNYLTDTWRFKNNLKIAFGSTKLGNADFRTTDNELYLEDVLSLNFGWAVDPYISNLVRTAIGPGYNYKVTPAPQIAAFFDPGYVTQSIGFMYDKVTGVSSRLGLAFQETFTNKHRNYSDDPDTPEIEAFKFETGLESVTKTEFVLAENLLAQSLLRLFTRFEQIDVWDVRWDNTITAKVNSFLNVNVTYLLIYEKSQSPETQMKQTLQLGFVYTLL
ncbi:MAG: DUF3078 domain-containing protein [Ignavibacteriaceae bacterium]|nr:DUF3078 domain-containing protein [Ignavibacteriaceae bacterium]